MSASSKIDIIGAAYALLGKEPPTSLGSSAPSNVKTCSFLYDIYYKALLTRHQWHFARRNQKLVQVSDFPSVVGYNYAYQIPSGYLRIYKLDPIVDYEIFGTSLYCNVSDGPTVYYIAYVPEGEIPEWYVEFLVEKMAAVFAMKITHDPNIMNHYEELSSKKLNRCIAIDAGSQPNEVIQNNPVAGSKFIGSLGS